MGLDRDHSEPDATPGLCACPRCASMLVQLVGARRLRPGLWHVRRRCPECGWCRSRIASAAALARLQRELDAGRDSLQRLLSAMQAPVGGPPAH